jgi:peptidoglycan/LPS O-acetylase OafA/YrhL
LRVSDSASAVAVTPTAAAPVELRRLNALRGLAAMIVVVSHFANAMAFHPALGHGAGQMGVMLFFLLSGFLMAYLYLGQVASTATLRRFAVARVARVVPLYYLVVLASFALTQWSYPDVLYRIADVPALLMALLFVRGDSVLWTIPPELQFYALFALAWLCKARLGAVLVFALIALVAVDFGLLAIVDIAAAPPMLKAFPYFAAGSVMGYAYWRWQIPARRRSHFYVLALVLIPLLYPDIFASLTGHQHAMWADVRVWFGMAAVFFAMVFLVPDGNRVLENVVGDGLGKISYSIYLLHLPVLALLQRAGIPSGWLGLVLFLAATCVAASASFALIEAPLRKGLRRRFAAAPQ